MIKRRGQLRIEAHVRLVSASEGGEGRTEIVCFEVVPNSSKR